MKILCVLETATAAEAEAEAVGIARATGIMLADSPKKCKRKVKESMFGLVWYQRSAYQSVFRQPVHSGRRFKKEIELNEEIEKTKEKDDIRKKRKHHQKTFTQILAGWRMVVHHNSHGRLKLYIWRVCCLLCVVWWCIVYPQHIHFYSRIISFIKYLFTCVKNGIHNEMIYIGGDTINLSAFICGKLGLSLVESYVLEYIMLIDKLMATCWDALVLDSL